MATIKQEKAKQIYLANRGMLSVAETMRQAGYSEASARNPKNLTESASWQEMMDHYLPDDKLLKKHINLLDATKIERAEFPTWIGQEKIGEILRDAGCSPRNYEENPLTGITHVWYWAPDTRAQAAALDLAYKLKGKQKLKVERLEDIPVAMVEFIGDDPTDFDDEDATDDDD